MPVGVHVQASCWSPIYMSVYETGTKEKLDQRKTKLKAAYVRPVQFEVKENLKVNKRLVVPCI